MRNDRPRREESGPGAPGPGRNAQGTPAEVGAERLMQRLQQQLDEYLLAGGRADQNLLDQIDRGIESDIARAVQSGLAAPFPNQEEVGRFVYA